jgi:hypothetical protein
MVRNVEWFSENNDRGSERRELNITRDLLPWADPYIAALIASLERECLNNASDLDGMA